MAIYAIMRVMCSLRQGEQKHNVVARNQSGLGLMPTMSRRLGQWARPTGGPLKVVLALPGMAEMQMQAEVESHWLIQTLSKVAFHSASGSSSLYSCSSLVALD